MSQDIILDNLIKFIIIVEKKFSHEIRMQLRKTNNHTQKIWIMRQIKKHKNEFPLYLNALKVTFKTGMCFGFSICHGIMQELEELEWWEKALRLTADWQGEPLDKKIILIRKESTRYHIFERVLNYICFTSCNFEEPPLSGFLLKGMTQETLLKPPITKPSHIKYTEEPILKHRASKPMRFRYTLDFLDHKKNTQTVQNSVFISGSFTPEQLELLLKFNLREGILGIVHSKEKFHAVRIGKKNENFIIYNANNDHTSPKKSIVIQPIYKKFDSLIKMIEELIKIQGSSMAINLASFNNEQFDLSYYDELVSNLPVQLIKNKGLHHIAHFNPIVCKKIITMAKFSPALELTLTTELLRSLSDDWTGFHFIARFACQAMHHLIIQALDKSCKNVYAVLPELLVKKNNRDWTSLHLLARYCPHSLSNLLKDKSHTKIYNVLPLLLIAKNKDHWTGLHMIAHCAPESLTTLAHYIEETNDDLRQQFFNALALKNADGHSGLNFIIDSKPELIPQLINIIKRDETLAKKFVKAVQDSTKFNHIEITRYIDSREKFLFMQNRPHKQTQFSFMFFNSVKNCASQGLTRLGNTFIVSHFNLKPTQQTSDTYVEFRHSR